MNIVVKTANGFTLTRPDTTWERYNRDFYVPEFIQRLSWAPVLFAPVTHAGKFIQPQFAANYFGKLCYGILFYPQDDSQAPEAFAQACCLNHSSFLADPVPDGADAPAGTPFTFHIDGKEAFKADAIDCFVPAFVSASTRVLFRAGDLVALELAPRMPLTAGGTISFKGIYDGCKVPLIDFQVIM